MHTIEIPKINFKTEIASVIDELKPKEYLGFVQLLIAYSSKAIDYITFRINLAILLMNFQKSKKKIPAGEMVRINENIFLISEHLDSFCRTDDIDGKEVLAIETYFIKNLVPSIELTNGKLLYGPDDALLNVKALEFKEAHNCFAESEDGKNEAALNNLVAILYRPEIENYAKLSQREDFDGQRRIKFNPVTVEKRAAQIAELPYHVKYAVWLWFANCETYLYEGKPTIDGIEIDFSILYTKKTDDNKPKLGMTDLLFSMAETGLFGKMNETMEQVWYDMMFAMYRNKIHFDEIKSKTPKQND